MVKLTVLIVIAWFCLFTLRVILIGGIDPTYRDSEATLLLSFRQQLVEKLQAVYPKPHSDLLVGILIGEQGNLPNSLKSDLKATSTIHMVVASGQNLTLLSGFTMSLVGIFGKRKAILLTVIVLIVYATLTGLQIPILRASFMTFVTFAAAWLGRELLGWWVLLFTAGAMLLYNPHWLLSISFQLSFLATAGVMIVAPILIKRLTSLPLILRNDVAVAIGAQLATIPIIAYNFQQLSLVGVIVNSLIGWTIPFVMLTGMVSLVGGVIATFIGQLLAIPTVILLTYFIYLVQFFADFPLANISLPNTNLSLWAGYYILLIGLLWRMHLFSSFSKSSLSSVKK